MPQIHKVLYNHCLLLLPIFFLVIILCIDGLYTVFSFRTVTASTKVYDAADNLIYESINGLEGYQTPIELADLPDYVLQAVVATEDSRYYSHFGVDPFALVRALKSNVASGRIVSGGSTITQQIARKHLAFTSSRVDKSHGVLPIHFVNFIKRIFSNKYIRKIREINSAVFLELVYSKNAILEKYLNSVYFGNKSYGIEAASNTYFNKPASQLTLPESAILAGSIRAPVTLNPKDNLESSIDRRNVVLDSMYLKKFISADELDLYKSFPIGVTTRQRDTTALHSVEFAIQEARNILSTKDIDISTTSHIYTTIRSDIQMSTQDIAISRVDNLSKKHKLSNAAVVVLDTSDSAILAMLGSVDYFNESINGSVNMAFAKRQPGSALKPITYAQAFYENLLTPDDIIIDEKTSFTTDSGVSFTPYNYNGVFNGPVTARTALASSLNLPAVKVLDMIGVSSMIQAAQRLGIKSLTDTNRYGLSVTLGGGEVTLLELTNAYNSFARGGIYKKPYIVRKIVDNNSHTIYKHPDELGEFVWGDRSQIIADIILDILSDPDAKVLGFGRNNVLTLPFKAASKTGTTTDWHDNWAFGYTPAFTVGVWVGNTDNSPMFDIDGVTGAGPIWRDIMLKVHNALYTPLDSHQGTQVQETNNSGDTNLVSIPEDTARIHIINPAPNTEYLINPAEAQFQRILFEVTVPDTINSVDYVLNGTQLKTVTSENAFKYLWVPSTGSYTLKAICKSKNGAIVQTDEINFYVTIAL